MRDPFYLGNKLRTHHAEAICIFESSSEIFAFSFLKSMSFWRFRKYLSDTPKNLLSLRDVSAVILRRPCSISWMRDVGTSMALAKLYALIPIGAMNSSFRISPMVGVLIKSLIITPPSSGNQRFQHCSTVKSEACTRPKRQRFI